MVKIMLQGDFGLLYRGDANNYYAMGYCSALFDVTSTTNCKASLQVDHQQNDTINYEQH